MTIFVRPLAARAAEVARGIAAAAEGADRPVLAVWLGADTPAAEDTGAIPRLRDARRRRCGRSATPSGYARHRAAPAGPAVRARRRRHRDGGDDRGRGPRAGRRLAAARRRRAPAAAAGASRWWRAGSSPRRTAAGRAAAELGGAGRAQGDRARSRPQERRRRRAARADRADRRRRAPRARWRRSWRRLARPSRASTSSGWRPQGTELIVGAVGDPAFGPLVACGAGGVAVELLGDVQVRLAPLGAREADGMLRGSRPSRCSTATAAARRPTSIRCATSSCASARWRPTHPAIAELDLNPVIATPEGALVVDARVRLEAPGPGAGVPVAQRLSTTADYGTVTGSARRWRRRPPGVRVGDRKEVVR